MRKFFSFLVLSSIMESILDEWRRNEESLSRWRSSPSFPFFLSFFFIGFFFHTSCVLTGGTGATVIGI